MMRRALAAGIGLGICLGLAACEPQAATPGGSSGAGGVAFVAGDGVFNEGFVEIARGAAEGAYIITPYVNDESDPAIKEFSASFKEMYKGKEPDAWAALTYDAVGIYARVIAEVGPDRAKIRAALEATNSEDKGFPGVTGNTVFNEDGDCSKPAIVSVVKGGKLIKADIQLSKAKSGGVWKMPKGELKADAEPIVLGVAGPLTGGSAELGQQMRWGAELRAKEINDAGGIAGRRLELRWGDDEGNNSKAVNVAKDLASDAKVVAIVGHFNSTCSNAAKNVYKQAGIAMLSPGSTNVEVCKGNEWAFRNLYRDDFQGFLIAQFIKESLNCKKVVVFYDNDDYGKGLKQFFVMKAKELGLEVAAEIPYQRDLTADYKPLVTDAKFKAPDAIFVAGLYNEAALIAKAAKTAGLLP